MNMIFQKKRKCYPPNPVNPVNLFFFSFLRRASAALRELFLPLLQCSLYGSLTSCMVSFLRA